MLISILCTERAVPHSNLAVEKRKGPSRFWMHLNERPSEENPYIRSRYGHLPPTLISQRRCQILLPDTIRTADLADGVEDREAASPASREDIHCTPVCSSTHDKVVTAGPTGEVCRVALGRTARAGWEFSNARTLRIM